MTQELLQTGASVPRPCHAPREEYAHFVATLSPYRAGGAFVNRTSYDARTYLLFLGLTGRLTFDWDWLLSVPLLSFWRFADLAGRPEANATRQTLIAEALGHGYAPHSASYSLGWALSRLMLRTGNLGAEHLTDTHVAEFLDAIRRLGSHPDVPAMFGSATRYHHLTPGWTTSIHLLKVVLYHRGQLEEPPRPAQPKWGFRPSLPDKMAVVIERYLLARRLTDRPGTVAHTRPALLRFAGWLAALRPTPRALST